MFGRRDARNWLTGAAPPVACWTVASLVQAQELLRRHFGYASFRPAQRKVVASVLTGRDVLAVLPTGGGKSICFQVPALVQAGLTVVVSPLISLMQDQVAAACARGVPAAALHSALDRAGQEAVLGDIASGRTRLLYLSPERLGRAAVTLRQAAGVPALLAIDEAHCIAEWGDDFRPSYRALRRVRYLLGQPQTIALTGSATPEVRRSIVAALGLGRRYGRGPAGFDLHLGSFDRPNLWFGAVRVEDERDRMARLLALLADHDQMTLVYAPTRNSTERIAVALRRAGHRAVPYHAGLDKERRAAVLQAFLADRIEVVVATCAFGMGIDKPDVRLVVHWSAPPTPESYYQEAGRAGRDGRPCRCVVLWRPTDAEIHRRQLDVTFPDRELAERVWRNPAARATVPRTVLASIDRLGSELKPVRGPVDWRPVMARRKKAERRLAVMEEYLARSSCRRQSLLAYFGERLGRCAGCDQCQVAPSAARLPPAAAQRLRQLRAAVGLRRGPWGGALLDAEVMLRLAVHPPEGGAALAEVAGVGPELAARLGGTILDALSPPRAEARALPERSPLLLALEQWRDGVAKAMGVPPYLVLTDAALVELASRRPSGWAQVADVPGVGPRALAKFAPALLEILAKREPERI